MQRAEIVLANLKRKSFKKEDYQFTRLYRNLFNSSFYLNAYAKLASNAGNLTKGVDENTIDGFGGKRIRKLIEDLRYERYKPKPVRRVYIPKKNGKLRPLGILSFYDKIVQEILRQMLEAIYEPIFSRNSHGFRPHRSCHTALQQIHETGNGTSWIIEGDIKAFFDNIDHAIMMDILSKRIKDGRFLSLIRKFLKSGVMEEGKIRDTLSGAPQGGVISPILSNIYLHELDSYMEAISQREYRGECRRRNKEYVKIHARKYRRIQTGKHKEAKELLQIQRMLSSVDSMDPNYRRVRYVRYADDFVVLVIGPKSMAQRIKLEISNFISSRLNIELSQEKTVITNPLKGRCRFLGYDIVKGKDNTQVVKAKNGRKVKTVKGVLQLLVPGNVIREKIQAFERHGKPAHRSDRLNTPVEGLIAQYNNEIRGLVNYYCMAANVSR
jgi:group II intron reverse transcriptase/maturase